MKFICLIPLLVSLAAANPTPWNILRTLADGVADAVDATKNLADNVVHCTLGTVGTLGSKVLNGANCVVDDTAHAIGKYVPVLKGVTNGIQSVTNGVNFVGQKALSDTANGVQDIAGAATTLADNTVRSVATAVGPVSAVKPAPAPASDSTSS